MPLRSPDSFGTKSGKPRKLPWLTNQEFDEVEARARELGLNLNICPTCGTRINAAADPVDDLPGPDMPTQGEYRYDGKVHVCNCEEQDALRRRYLLANIPIKYWRYGHEDWYGPHDAWLEAQEYLSLWPQYKANGIGIEFYSPGQGSGKTFLATWIARQLVQKGERVYYTRMLTLMNLRENPKGQEIEQKVRAASALVLDEVGYGITDSQTTYYAHTLEDMVRDRVDNAQPTIMTTNMLPSELSQYYPRIYSVLAGSQGRVEVDHEDVRVKLVTIERDKQLIKRGETRPIR